LRCALLHYARSVIRLKGRGGDHQLKTFPSQSRFKRWAVSNNNKKGKTTFFFFIFEKYSRFGFVFEWWNNLVRLWLLLFWWFQRVSLSVCVCIQRLIRQQQVLFTHISKTCFSRSFILKLHVFWQKNGGWEWRRWFEKKRPRGRRHDSIKVNWAATIAHKSMRRWRHDQFEWLLFVVVEIRLRISFL
jgi:hypothetical protein